MQKNFENFSTQDILRLAKSPAGQQLMELLRSDHGQLMQSVQEKAQAGQMDQVKSSLFQLLADPRAQDLLRQLQEEHHG